MRVAGRQKSGYFPIPDQALDAILQHLALKGDPSETFILDPCAGEGHAIARLGDKLGIPRPNIHAIELNPLRAERIAEAYPDISLLAPCDFQSSRVSYSSFGLVYLNPPFDSEYGGGQREEKAFLHRAANLIAPNGVLVMVCPWNQVLGKSDMCEFLDTWFRGIEFHLFPAAHRQFREIVITGIARKKGADEDDLWQDKDSILSRGIGRCLPRSPEREYAELGNADWIHWRDGRPASMARQPIPSVYSIPRTPGPKKFEKTSLTSEEVAELLTVSPLYDRIAKQTAAAVLPPPLSLGKGHVSLLAMSGSLNGYVPSDPPHIMRGYTLKTEKLIRTESKINDSGKETVKHIYTEQPQPIVRAVFPDGVIRTFGEPKAKIKIEEATKPEDVLNLEQESEDMPEDEL